MRKFKIWLKENIPGQPTKKYEITTEQNFPGYNNLVKETYIDVIKLWQKKYPERIKLLEQKINNDWKNGNFGKHSHTTTSRPDITGLSFNSSKKGLIRLYTYIDKAYDPPRLVFLGLTDKPDHDKEQVKFIKKCGEILDQYLDIKKKMNQVSSTKQQGKKKK